MQEMIPAGYMYSIYMKHF